MTLTLRDAEDNPEQGSMPLAMLLTIIAVGLSVIISSTFIQTLQATRSATGRAAALLAAQAGLESALASIRAAADADGIGRIGHLPCAAVGTPQLLGTVTADGNRYEVTIAYLTQDPASRDRTWIYSTGRPCANLLSRLPRFAYVEAVGIAVAGDRRTLYGTYTFRNATTGSGAGGVIRGMPGVNTCIDAGPSPAAGYTVRMQPCATKSDGTPVDRQLFTYQANITLTLAGTSAAYPDGLCLDAGWPQAVGNVVKLQPCGTSTQRQQQWSYNFATAFVGTDDGMVTNDKCFAREAGTDVGSRIILNDMNDSLNLGTYRCDERFKDSHHTWYPTPQVGSAAAGLPVTRQIVNQGQYGRCLDVTLENPDEPYEIIFPCKQSPNPAARDWNQQWTLPSPGTVGAVWANTPKGSYCLTLPSLSSSPLTVDARLCIPEAPAAATTWRSRGAETESADAEYRIEGVGEWAGWCLAPVVSIWDDTAAKVGIVRCSGEADQKWNAEPEANAAHFTGIGER
jgi:hypothetical protein